VAGPSDRGAATGGTVSLAVTIRLEAADDQEGIRAVELAAFPGPEEAGIVDRVRLEAPAGWQSLVAVDADGRIVGHLLMTPCPVLADEGSVAGEVLSLGPMAVEPGVQRQGIGSALMGAAMSLAVARAVPAVVLLGHPSYYPRFGFTSARDLGLEPPAQAWPDAAWLARRLPAWTDDLRGTVRYPEAFEPLA
jgi:putative acetyltransferase